MIKNKYLAIVALWLAIVLLTCCKKKEEERSPYVRANINGVTQIMSCYAAATLDSNSYLLVRPGPNTTCDNNYNVYLRFKMIYGAQSHDTLSQYALQGVYILLEINTAYMNSTVYSLFSSSTQATITVTNIDEANKRIKGTFSGTLTAETDSTERIEITNGIFSVRYQ